ncbi:MAG TPA: hypothetical protein VFY01_04500, partial [Rheinheimera sp.]|nr:hypothetical protein [Rheinheimera sp.]
SKEALEADARNEAVLFPGLKPQNQDSFSYVLNFFSKPQHQHWVVGNDAPYRQYWHSDGQVSSPKQDKNAIDALLIAASQIQGQSLPETLPDATAPTLVLVQSWVDGETPLSPVARIALSAADIALEYVGHYPGIIGGGNGANLISAYAQALAQRLPDDGQLSNRHQAWQTLSGMMLRAGFETLSRHPDWVTDETHLVALIESTIDPIVDAFPLDSNQQIIQFDLLRETLSGPATKALLNTVAQHPGAFFGEQFGTEKALGLVTQALFVKAAELGLNAQFSQQGLLQSFQITLEVIAQRPQLFVQMDSPQLSRFSQDLLGKMAGVLAAASYPFDQNVTSLLLQQALLVTSQHAQRMLSPDKPWQSVAANMVSALLSTLAPHVGQHGALRSVFQPEQLTELGRIVLRQVAQSPQMISDAQQQGKNAIIVALATAMSEDEQLLLTADNWLEIVSVAAAEAAANPLRLFKLEENNPNHVVAGELMAILLRSASTAATQHGLSNVLFGKTLQQAITLLLQVCSGNVQTAKAQLAQIEHMVVALNRLVASYVELFGSKEWLRLYRILLQRVMSGIELPELTVEFANQLLSGDA